MSAKREILWLELGVEPYDRIWDLQHRLVKERQANRIKDVILLLEHEPVITLGRHADESNILATPEHLAALGVQVRHVERGGDVTYHGPGQLVGYPILRLADYGLGASDYMHALEETLIHTLSDLGVASHRRDGFIGVWTELGKIAALGVRIEKGITYHGFALNVDPEMTHFQLIVPCGLQQERVTSMAQVLGRKADMASARACFPYHFARVFNAKLARVTLGDLVSDLQA